MISELRRKKDEDRKNQTRMALLDAAREIFIAKGYHQSNISDIVARAKVGQGTFYRNFKDKREIFETLVEMFVFDLVDKFTEMKIKQPTNTREYREASITALSQLARHIEENRDMTRLFMRETKAVDRNFEETIKEMCSRFAEIARYHLDNAIKAGFARPCRSDIVAESLVGIGWRMIDEWVNDSLPQTGIDELIREISDFAFMGFGVVQAREIIEKQ